MYLLFIPVLRMFIIKNHYFASRFCITDSDSLVSISLYFFWKTVEIDSFSIPEALLTRF